MSQSVRMLLYVLISRIVGLSVSLVRGFVIPALLSIVDYGIYKSFGLYSSFAGLTHLGMVDGIYIEYGGRDFSKIDKKDLSSQLCFMLIVQVVFVLPILLFGMFAEDFLFYVFLSASFLGGNLVAFFSYLAQATSQFKIFSYYHLLGSFVSLLCTLAALIFRVSWFYYFIALDVLIKYIEFAILFRKLNFRASVGLATIFSKRNWLIAWKGFIIYFGNFSSVLFYSMDRWFVKILLRTEDFAFYSFATSMMGMVMILVSSVAMTFYPMLARRQEEEGLLRSLKSYLMIIGSFAGAAYFGFDLIVNWILRDYLSSLEVIAILFAGFPAIAVINAIYVNMYKAQKTEKKYFFTVFGMVAVSFGLNALAVVINRSNWTIAAATTIAFYFWFFFSSKDFKGAKTNLREIAYLSAFLIVFFSTTRLLPWWLGLPLYLAGIFGITLLFYKKEFFELISKVSGALVRKTRGV